MLKGQQIWNQNKDVNSDLIIKKKSKLTITNQAEIALAKDRKIILEKGASIEIDNAKIGNFCEEMWGGIQLKSNKKGSISIINGGKLIGPIREYKNN